MAYLLTPVPWSLPEVFEALVDTMDSVFWLDSSQDAPDDGARSMLTLALKPLASMTLDEGLQIGGKAIGDAISVPPWATLDRLVGQYRQRDKGNPGGMVAWISYTAGFLNDDGPTSVPHPPGVPLLEVYETDAALIEKDGKVMLLVCGDTPSQANLGTVEWVRTIQRGLREAAAASGSEPTRDDSALECTDPGSKTAYLSAISAIQAGIAAGTYKQVCPTYPIRFRRPASMAAWYLALRARAPAGYSAFVRTPSIACASSSPECLFEIQGRTIRTRPMKGTRKRGDQPDAVLAEELRTNPKDRAENTMIAERACRDLEAVCQEGSAQITESCTVESYATVMQLTSTIEGALRGNVGPFAAYAALAPPASMTGEPKDAACAALADLETTPRGLYSGSVAWIEGSQRAQFNVLIRSLWAPAGEDEAAWHVGGGIIAQSDPEAEWAESRVKALAVVNNASEAAD